MTEKTIGPKTLQEWKSLYPLLHRLMSTQEVFWANPAYGRMQENMHRLPLGMADLINAEKRWERFAPYISRVFPETEKSQGRVESPLVGIPQMKEWMEERFQRQVPGKLLLKCDGHLPVSGSVKARGGIYEVLKHAEDLALDHGMLTEADDYAILDGERFKNFFSQFSLAVGSTGNLGLSIGIIGSQLGFQVTVHMSADARQWKKDLLRSKGVHVMEYQADYSKAVQEGRKQCQKDPRCYFIDDENSQDLFLGYAVAASRLKHQLAELNIGVDGHHPLFVYLPCGVGGGPGGITFGLKLLFKDHVHCFFAEPTHSPCMLIGVMTGLHNQVSVTDFGIDNITAADGLAVGRPSGFVGKTLEKLISGVYTVGDDHLYLLLRTLADTEKIYLEPSALAGMPGPFRLFQERAGQEYLEKNSLLPEMENATHIVWATGGSMVPPAVMAEYYQKGYSKHAQNPSS
ncbi:D-serine ammonia-lyase [Candidatus Formimonas warabiya]|uniref:Probable D-serine dehydratase n=1 Tax=Formimonas warabiya TaxID=1761012 RepID=A0A3G1KVN3_FORW1|nr:D-serine ammonia-lyase [Candidatus Formimonas warabiya]ATW26524.1 D-serine ammonia-lyase [Candidatus Formimonas warabiya]